MNTRSTPRAASVTLLALLALPACREAGPDDPWLDEVTAVAVPAGIGSRFPHLAAGHAGPIVLSWLQEQSGGGFALQHATWSDGSWGPSATVASGQDWFVNWADFPSVVPLGKTRWAAHWLQQKPGSVYAYDVRIAVSNDAGRNWSPPMSPHDDATPTEHGFVSLYDLGGEAHAAWLDGRHTGGGHDHAAGASGAMTLRSATIGHDGRRLGNDREIDGRVCDCCQTDAAITADGPVVVYRDRDEHELRDIAIVRHVDGRWSAPAAVHSDGWQIDACPVNGPAVDARGRTVAVAWFTAPDRPRVRLAFSDDAGRSFAPPIEVSSEGAVGRVDVVLLDDGRAVVSWLRSSQAGAQLLARPFTRHGAAGDVAVIAAAAVQRSSGFPQMVLAGDGLLFAWTDATAPRGVRAAYARLR
jgi:hypothetical protein